MTRPYTRVTPESTQLTVVIPARMRIQILSCRYCDDKLGPPGTDLIFDVRFLPDPTQHSKEVDPQLSGLDKDMQLFLQQSGAVGLFFKKLLPVVTGLLKSMQSAGRMHGKIAFRCSGGRHRSVYLAYLLAKHLRTLTSDLEVQEWHPELGGEQSPVPVPESSVDASEFGTARPASVYTYDPKLDQLHNLEVSQQSSEDMQQMLCVGLQRMKNRKQAAM